MRHSLLDIMVSEYRSKNPRKAFILSLLIWPLTTIIGLILLPIIIVWNIYHTLNQYYLKKKIEVDLAKQNVSVNWDKIVSNKK